MDVEFKNDDFLSNFNMSLHSVVDCIVSDEESTVIIIFVPI